MSRFIALLPLLLACPLGSQTVTPEPAATEPAAVEPEAVEPETVEPEAPTPNETAPETETDPEPTPEPAPEPTPEPEPNCDPGPGDKAGDDCCAPSNRESCTGRDVRGKLPKRSDAGATLVCTDGKWVEDNTDCTQACTDKGNELLGCIWNSKRGLTKPLCACK